jgi:hypothetical protein
MRKATILFVVAFFFFLARAASAQDGFEVFGGYSFSRLSTTLFTPSNGNGAAPDVCLQNSNCIIGFSPTITTSTINANGFEGTAVFKPSHVFGLAGDVTDEFGSTNGANVHLQTYMLGPQISLPGKKMVPFAHVLLGLGHESIGGNNTVPPDSANAIAWAAGGGLDVKMTHFISIRAVQFDYMGTRFFGSQDSRPRISAGVVLHF